MCRLLRTTPNTNAVARRVKMIIVMSLWSNNILRILDIYLLLQLPQHPSVRIYGQPVNPAAARISSRPIAHMC
jgi:hypothetical protein